MVMAEVASKTFNWKPDVMEGDDPIIFTPGYTITEEAVPSVGFFKSKFSDLPAFGIWVDRVEGDDELLMELGSGWRDFAAE
jgi:hypothetical protein